jgi:hypothetical protein
VADDPQDLLRLADPQNPFQQTVRLLAEAAMSVTCHDAAETEPGYIHDVQAMERKFSRILKGKMKLMRRARAHSTKEFDHG